MSRTDTLQISQQKLAEAWDKTLPNVLNSSDKAKVVADEADEKVLRITIETAGHSGYSFDFKCTYVDSREVKVELVDVESAGMHVDERTATIQTLIDDYVRHIHECASQLHDLTS
ncbi:hypothetical protein RAC89_12175 [Paenibacillus sp. GD4]|jgi:fructose-specific phosphotransferase system component IIB|uniref:hypothetical protein n=1 Tax=Paenibacillus TaxID=44249 RepID=UPI0025433447|nr:MULTISPECIES: hypothetical protein [Paenibacillus]MDQ1911203.1 hypothetical protein [Paenibacillus sp. GD4]